jgi:hypothetical protein
VEAEELERIARTVLRELGIGDAVITLQRAPEPDRWRLTVAGHRPASLIIRCGRGTSAQFVRTQIFEQFQRL